MCLALGFSIGFTGAVFDGFVFSKLGWAVVFRSSHSLCLAYVFGWKFWMKRRATEGYCGRALSCHVHKFRIWKCLFHHLRRQEHSAIPASFPSGWTLPKTLPFEINLASLSCIKLRWRCPAVCVSNALAGRRAVAGPSGMSREADNLHGLWGNERAISHSQVYKAIEGLGRQIIAMWTSLGVICPLSRVHWM